MGRNKKSDGKKFDLVGAVKNFTGKKSQQDPPEVKSEVPPEVPKQAESEEEIVLVVEPRIEGIARVCHEANRVYCASLGDESQVPWEKAPKWQKDSAIEGVRYALANSDLTPANSHRAWFLKKVEEGWSYGPTKDVKKKKHPCLVAYGELSADQKKKDSIFLGIVKVFML